MLRIPGRLRPWPVLLLALGFARVGRAQEVIESPGLRAGGVEVEFDGLVQTQFNTTSVDAVGSDGPEIETTDLLLRRVRLGATATINEWIVGRIQPEFAAAATGGSIELNEAYLLLIPTPGLQFLAGKGGRPFGIIDATVAPQLVPIERGARIRGIRPLELYGLLEEVAYAGRSVGLQVLGDPVGAPLGLTYAAGYFSGALGEEGPDADIEQFAGRLSIRPLDQVQLGVALTSRAFRCAEQAGCVAGEDERGGAYAIDATYGRFGEPGLHLLGEWSAGVLDPFADADYQGAQLWAAYRTPPLSDRVTGVEPLVRISYGDTDGPLDPLTGTLLTPGVNLYLGGLNRIMLNYDLWMPDGRDTEGSFKAQFQLAF